MSEWVAWAIIGAVCIVILLAEAAMFAPEKMPWNRRKEKKSHAGKR